MSEAPDRAPTLERWVPPGRAVVTGGAGFIGSALVAELNRRGFDEVLIVDRLRNGPKWKNLVPLRFADYVEADDFYPRLAREPEAFGDVRAVFHLGACSSTTERDAAYLVHNNYEASKTLGAWALARDARLVYASSAATYGGLERGLSESRPLASLRPLNGYGFSKQLFDCYAQRNAWLARAVGIKYFNVFGPGESHKGEMRSLVPKAFEQIRDGGLVRLFKSYRPEFADGCQRRDFVWIEDAVAATLFLAAEASAHGLYNVGSGRASSWLELVEPIFRTLGLPQRIEFIEMPEAMRPAYQYYTCAEIERLRTAGFAAAMTPLAEAVASYARTLAAEESAPFTAPTQELAAS
ncbi:MAG: ADP-glyceromanno-heptose 6-epimerase [Vulcanimicrobiaceae bacterium]